MTRLAKRMCSAVLAAGLVCGCILPASAAEAEEEARVLQYETAEPVSAVTANVENAELVIQAGQTDKITVESAASIEGKYTCDVSVKDGVLHITVDAVPFTQTEEWAMLKKAFIEGSTIPSLSIQVYDGTFIVTLPEKTYADLYAKVNNGSIQFEGVQADTLRGKVGNGEIVCEDVTAGTLQANVGNGLVSLENTRASSYKCTVNLGSIEGELAGEQSAYRIESGVGLGGSGLPDQPAGGFCQNCFRISWWPISSRRMRTSPSRHQITRISMLTLNSKRPSAP